MDKTALLELADRFEKAEGPDRLLDANIHWQVKREDFYADRDHRAATYCYARGGWTLNKADHYYLDSIPVPRYTASIDAAMSLVPEGWDWTADSSGEAFCSRQMDAHRGQAATPALALTAASLRALASGGNNDTHI